MSASVRKRLLAALDAAHGILNESDEFEAENATAKSALEATKAELEQEKVRLASAKAALAEAEANHGKWLEMTESERQRINGEITRLGEQPGFRAPGPIREPCCRHSSASRETEGMKQVLTFLTNWFVGLLLPSKKAKRNDRSTLQ